MGRNEAETPFKSIKAPPLAQEQTNIHLYPDWAALQAYRGLGVPFLAPYFNSAVAAGHFHCLCVWGPTQPFSTPYGFPYPAIYPHGGFHAPLAVPLVPTPSSLQFPSKSSVDMHQGLKNFDGLDEVTASIDNDNSTEDNAGGSVFEVSRRSSARHGIDGSIDGSDGNTGAFQPQRNSGSEGILSTDNDVKAHRSAHPLSEGEANATFRHVSVNFVTPSNIAGISVRPPSGNVETHAACVASPTNAGLPVEVCIQDKRQLKRERRKQANRESAKRSRLRKQAENEEMLLKYETLDAENKALKFEISQQTENLDKMRLESTALREKLKTRSDGST